MSDEPTFDFLAWEELPVGVRRNRKKMYNYLVSVLGGDTPGPTGTGTVTVTCQNENQETLLCNVILSTEPIDLYGQDDTGWVAFGQSTFRNPIAVLTVWDTTTHEPTENTQIPFGTYNIGALDNSDGLKYIGTLTIDGDEEVTLTLTSE